MLGRNIFMEIRDSWADGPCWFQTKWPWSFLNTSKDRLPSSDTKIIKLIGRKYQKKYFKVLIWTNYHKNCCCIISNKKFFCSWSFICLRTLYTKKLILEAAHIAIISRANISSYQQKKRKFLEWKDYLSEKTGKQQTRYILSHSI